MGIREAGQYLWPCQTSAVWLWTVSCVRWGFWSRMNSRVPTLPCCLGFSGLFIRMASGTVLTLCLAGRRSDETNFGVREKHPDVLVCVSRVVTFHFSCCKTPLCQLTFTSLRTLAAFRFGVWNLRICLFTSVGSLVVWSGGSGLYEFPLPYM